MSHIAARRTVLSLGAMDMRVAGHIDFFRKRAQAAVLTLTRAGEAYLASGDLRSAAAMFLDGAGIAAQAGMGRHAVDLVHRASLLTRSYPVISV